MSCWVFTAANVYLCPMHELELIHPDAENYAAAYTSELDVLLQELADFTQKSHPKFHMLSGSVQGKLLEMITWMINPVHVLEIGTFTGYSALCMARALGPSAVIHTIEQRPDDAETAQRYFNKSTTGNKIILHVGDAMGIIPSLANRWDMVFIDADKVNYTNYYEMLLPRVKHGGFIIADNVLFHGQVLKEPRQGKNAKAIHAFNEHVKNDTRVEEVLLTVRDGLLVIRKK